MSALKYWIWLSERKGVGAAAAHKLLEAMGSPENIYFADADDYVRAGIKQKDIYRLTDKNMDGVREIMDRCHDENWRILSIEDAMYPERLKNIYDAPLVLYVRGRLPVMDEEAAVAIVGTRRCSPYGIRSAEQIGYEVTKGGGLIVTGLARGIDTAAAWGALRAGGMAVGVLGCGLDVVYPPENRQIIDDVASVGAVISEYSPGTPAYAANFPARNRIISGISLGAVIIEAPAHSGALITAAHALEQGRDVFVVPGNIDAEACRGSNRLLREGGIPVMSGFDILEEYREAYPAKLGVEKPANMTPPEEDLIRDVIEKQTEPRQKESKKVIDNGESLEYIDSKKGETAPEPVLEGGELLIYNVLKKGEKHVDEIINECGLEANEVLSALTMLEINGHVKRLAGKSFALC